MTPENSGKAVEIDPSIGKRANYRTWRLVLQAFQSPERKRLRAAIGVLRADVGCVPALEGKCSTSFAELLAQADIEARQGDLYSGWKYLHEASRQLVTALPATNIDAAITYGAR